MKLKLLILAFSAGAMCATAVAQSRPVLYVNNSVTTHLLMPEQLKMVDISTGKIVGDQCTDNMVRIKPVSMEDSIPFGDFGSYVDKEFLATITLIGERHMAQYDVVYTSNPSNACSLYKVSYEDGCSYSNPDVAMPEAEMANFSWAICGAKRKFNAIRSRKYGINAQVYNIYSIGNYFFIDLYLKNKTNIQYDIAQMRVTLSDKKESKATNTQTLELTPAYVLNNQTSFNKDYRQVIVLEKLTFPEEKILNIEIAEDQISGRVINIPIEYQDILNADTFDGTKVEAYKNVRKQYADVCKILNKKDARIGKLQKQIQELGIQNLNLEENVKAKDGTIKGLKHELRTKRNKLSKSVYAVLKDLETAIDASTTDEYQDQVASSDK